VVELEGQPEDEIESADPIAMVAGNLRDRGLIGPDVQIRTREEDSGLILPISTNLQTKRITFSRDMRALCEDELRFCILHENAHIQLSRRFSIFVCLAILLWIVALILLLRGDAFSVLGAIPMLFLGRMVYGSATYRFELKADYRAGHLMKSEFHVMHPSMVAKSALSHVRELKSDKRSRAEKFLRIIGYKHPKDEVRVTGIAARLDGDVCAVGTTATDSGGQRIGE